MSGRRMAESLMVDRCIIRRIVKDANGKVVLSLDEETLKQLPSFTVVYDGKCSSAGVDVQVTNTVAAEQVFPTMTISLQIPVGAGPVAHGDIVEITECVYDPEFVGRKLRILDLSHSTLQTAQRMRAMEEL